jgi:acylglycerol lipase
MPRVKQRKLILAVHDEPSPEKEVFINDVADWILARSTEPVQVAEGAKPKL